MAVDADLALSAADLADASAPTDRAAGLLPWAAGRQRRDDQHRRRRSAGRARRRLPARAAVAARRCRLRLGGVLTPDGRRLLARHRAGRLDHARPAQVARPDVRGRLPAGARRASCWQQAFALRPEYMQDVEPAEDEVNFADRGIALTRRFRALKVWLSVKVLGLGWFRRLVGARVPAGGARRDSYGQAAGFEVLSRAAQHRLFSLRPGRRTRSRSD